MKICPRCQKTYVDDNLNFCLEDGSVLTQQQQAAELPSTEPQIQMPSQPGGQPAWNTAPQQQQQQYSMQPPRKSSKTWIWVLLILGVLALVCGGGGIILVFLASQADKTTSTTLNSNSPTTSSSPATNSFSSTTSTSTSGRTALKSATLANFVQKFSVYGTTEMVGDELMVAALTRGYYYALVAPDDFSTINADTRVTVRNVDNAASRLGYGLIFHSDPKPLQQDYAFLIDTKRKKYHVVHHTPQTELSVVGWTSSSAINEGSAENTLEARDQGDTIDLYINGTKVTSIKNVYGFAGGVAGLYSGDGVKIGFKNLETRK